MEHVVTITEIVTEIIQHVHDDDPKDTYSCMLVNKLWSKIALDFIWHVVSCENRKDAFVKLHVLQSLCNDKAGEQNIVQNSSKSLETNQRSRNTFDAYSNRVRCFCVRPSFDDDVKPRIDDFVNLNRLCPFPLIFPNLQSLEVLVRPDKDGSLAYITRYFCDSLRKVRMSFVSSRRLQTSVTPSQPSSPPNCDNMLRQLSNTSPNIKELHLDVPLLAQKVPERTLLDILPRFQSLEMLTLEDDMLTLPILTFISRLPKLKSLAAHTSFSCGGPVLQPLSIGNRMQAICKGTSADGRFFPSLRVFDALLQTADFAALHFSHFPLSQIRNLRVVSIDAMCDPSMSELIADIAQSFMHLQVLRIELPYFIHHMEGISARPFAALQQFYQLTELELLSNVAFSISDDDLANLVKWIPSLAYLCIGSEDAYSADHKFTLNALNVLSHQPNKLRVLKFQTYMALHSNVLCIADRKDGPGVFLKELKECILFTGLTRGSHFSEEELVGVQEFLDKCLSEACARQVRRQIEDYPKGV